jgi:hypothetical protein
MWIEVNLRLANYFLCFSLLGIWWGTHWEPMGKLGNFARNTIAHKQYFVGTPKSRKKFKIT